MNTRSPLRILLITPLDYTDAWNNREHNMAREYHALGCEVTVMYKVTNRSTRKWQMAMDCITMSCRRRKQVDLTMIRVDPFFNYFGGLGTNARAGVHANPARLNLKYRLIRWLAGLAGLRLVFVIPCFLIASFFCLRGRYHAAVGFGPWGSAVAWLLRKMNRVDLLVYEDRDYEAALMPEGLRFRFTAWLESQMIRRAKQVVANSRRLIALRQSQTPRTIHYIPTGVNWQRFETARTNKTPGANLVYVGNIVHWSGLEQTIRALPAVINRHPQVRLLIIGKALPAYEACLKTLVDSMNLQQYCRFLGSISNHRIPDILADGHIGLANSRPVPFRQYACPLKVIEYMAAAMPVIATDDTEAGDMVRRFDCGLVIPDQTPAIEQAICRILDNDHERQRMIHNAVRESRELNWEHLMRSELDIIRSSLGQKESEPVNRMHSTC